MENALHFKIELLKSVNPLFWRTLFAEAGTGWKIDQNEQSMTFSKGKKI